MLYYSFNSFYTIIRSKLTSVGLGSFASGQNASGTGQCPTEYPFCADLGT